MSLFLTKKNIAIAVAVFVIVAIGWFWTTDNINIWPIRHLLQYRFITWWSGPLLEPSPDAPSGTLTGTVRDPQNRPIENGWVLVPHRSGATYSSRTTAAGHYEIENVPAGTYRPVAGAFGYKSTYLANSMGYVAISAGAVTNSDVTLLIKPARTATPGQALTLSDPVEVGCDSPLKSESIRRELQFDSDGSQNQPAFYYTPLTTPTGSPLPLLLVIYPGPADTWECASSALSNGGYAVLAAGPAYTFLIEDDLDELERLLMFARQGQLPATDGRRIALLGGSYSSLHVQRLLQRGQENVEAALLLGPPTDLFDMRRRLENGTFLPPFGLDQALIAVGLPDQVPLHYFDYSGAYHVRADFPPLAILHSRSDDVVPYQQSELLAANLDAVGASYEAHFFDGASHYLMAEGGDEDTQAIYAIALDFLARHLQ